jgi:hypothetical protein
MHRRPRLPPYALGVGWERRIKIFMAGLEILFRGAEWKYFLTPAPPNSFGSIWGALVEML